jgi:hypothetical protein
MSPAIGWSTLRSTRPGGERRARSDAWYLRLVLAVARRAHRPCGLVPTPSRRWSRDEAALVARRAGDAPAREPPADSRVACPRSPRCPPPGARRSSARDTKGSQAVKQAAGAAKPTGAASRRAHPASPGEDARSVCLRVVADADGIIVVASDGSVMRSTNQERPCSDDPLLPSQTRIVRCSTGSATDVFGAVDGRDIVSVPLPAWLGIRIPPARRRRASALSHLRSPAGGGADTPLATPVRLSLPRMPRTIISDVDAALDAIYLAEPDSRRIVYANGGARQSGWCARR